MALLELTLSNTTPLNLASCSRATQQTCQSPKANLSTCPAILFRDRATRLDAELKQVEAELAEVAVEEEALAAEEKDSWQRFNALWIDLHVCALVHHVVQRAVLPAVCLLVCDALCVNQNCARTGLALAS